jgi:hypothetical protein
MLCEIAASYFMKFPLTQIAERLVGGVKATWQETKSTEQTGTLAAFNKNTILSR